MKRISKLMIIMSILLCGIAAKPITGFYEKDGNMYYDENGVNQKGIIKVSGNYYFFGEYTGKMQKGLVTSSYTGDTYYANEQGVLQKGFVTINENRYYFNEEGKMQKGFTKVGTDAYFFGEYTGKMQKGLVTSSFTGDKYYATESGKLHFGLKEIEHKKYYFDEKEAKMRYGFINITDNKWYYADNAGVLLTGEHIIKQTKYYFDSESILNQGFQKKNDATYYYINGYLQTGITEIAGEEYFLGEYSGKVQTGFVTSSFTGERYYTNEYGVIQKGITRVGDKDYFLGEYSGKVQVGLVKSSFTGKYYYTSETGGIYKNKFTIGDKTYYATETGNLLEGFQSIDQETYYFIIGQKQYGLKTIQGTDYFLGEYTGRVMKGFVTSSFNGATYYTDETGKILKGITEIEGQRYFLGEISGKMQIGWVHALTGKIYYTNENGIIQTGEQYIEGRAYIFDEFGVIKTGFQTIDGKTYYYNFDGSVVTGVQKIHGTRYRFAPDGLLKDTDFKLFADISYHQGNIDWDTLWNSGEVDGVIMRIGYNGTLDPQFANYLQNVKQRNIPYGVYLFSYAHNPAEAIFEANATIQMLKKYNVKPNYPVYYDIESYNIPSQNESSDDISKEAYEGIVYNYINALKAAGYDSKVYTGLNYAMNRLNENTRKMVEWIAHYTAGDCGYTLPYKAWQYTSTGSVSGIYGNVDLNLFYY